MEFNSTPTRVPAALWESLQEICWRQDLKFLEDAARILNVPAAEIKRRVLGTRGVLSAVVSTNSTWYEGMQCPIMIPGGGEMWRRCCEPAECNGFCWGHKKGKGLRHDSDYFRGLPVRTSWRLDGTLVWVADDGAVYDEVGRELKGLTIDITNGIAHDSRPVAPSWTREEIAAAHNTETSADSDNE